MVTMTAGPLATVKSAFPTSGPEVPLPDTREDPLPAEPAIDRRLYGDDPRVEDTEETMDGIDLAGITLEIAEELLWARPEKQALRKPALDEPIDEHKARPFIMAWTASADSR